MSKAQVGVDKDGHFWRGDPNAPVKFIEYSDFQCPYCERFATQTEPEINQNYVLAGKVLHIYKNFPLTDIHPNAMPAAKAAYCLGQQKPALFWAMADWMFNHQSEWVDSSTAADVLRKQAIALGADGTQFDDCIKSGKADTAIQADLAAGAKDGVQGTPAFFVNDWSVSGAQPFSEFQKTIDKALQGQHPAPTPTPLPAGVLPYDPDPNRPGRTYDGSPSLGDPKAPLVMIGFEDEQCKSCASFAKDVESALNDKYVKNGQLRIVQKFYPTNAPNAAQAALCALDQGKFWEYRNNLLAKQAEWKDSDTAALTNYAKTLGLDEAKFTKCLQDKPGQSQIDNDQAIAQQVGVDKLPYFLLINPKAQQGTRLPGALPLADVEKSIQQILNPPPTPNAEPIAPATPGQ